MVRVRLIVGVMAWWWFFGFSHAYAVERRPIRQLPSDMARWSTMWVTIPQQMIAVGQDYGPLAALTLGPAEGAVAMTEAAGRELWSASKPDKRPGQTVRAKDPKGPLFRYEF